jgi:hypothetical protein
MASPAITMCGPRVVGTADETHLVPNTAAMRHPRRTLGNLRELALFRHFFFAQSPGATGVNENSFRKENCGSWLCFGT